MRAAEGQFPVTYNEADLSENADEKIRTIAVRFVQALGSGDAAAERLWVLTTSFSKIW